MRSVRGPAGDDDGGATAVMASGSLLVRFHEPEPLVHTAGDFGEDVGATRVLELVHLLDAEPGRPAEHGERVGEGRHVLRTGRQADGIVHEAGSSLDNAHGTLGDATE